MNLFKTFTMAWWQVGLLKLSLLALGIAIGATWPLVFLPWLLLLLLLFILPAIYLFWVWYKQ